MTIEIKVSIKIIGDRLVKEGNTYPYLMKCPECGREYFALFDKMFIEHMGMCYYPCGNSQPEIEIAAENILALIQEVL